MAVRVRRCARDRLELLRKQVFGPGGSLSEMTFRSESASRPSLGQSVVQDFSAG